MERELKLVGGGSVINGATPSSFLVQQTCLPILTYRHLAAAVSKCYGRKDVPRCSEAAAAIHQNSHFQIPQVLDLCC